jgi:hypothetical protein
LRRRKQRYSPANHQDTPLEIGNGQGFVTEPAPVSEMYSELYAPKKEVFRAPHQAVEMQAEEVHRPGGA